MLSSDAQCPVCRAERASHARPALPRRLWALAAARPVDTSTICDRCAKEAEAYCSLSYVCDNLDSFCARFGSRASVEGRVGQEGDPYRPLLTAVCREFQASFVWFDKACLSAEPDEKGPEILSMGEYYRRAPLCVALLDHVVMEGDELLGTLNAGKLRRRVVSRGADDLDYYFWAIQRLNSNGMCNDNWFERVWTAQEYCNSPRCVAWDGQFALDLTRLAAALFSAEGNDRLAVKAALEKLPRAFGETMMLWRDVRFEQVDLLTALWMTKSRKCTLEQDRVYGILGMLSRQLRFPVAYDVGVDEALARALRAAIAAGDVSSLAAIDTSAGLFPSCRSLLRNATALRLAHVDGCAIVDDGLSVPIVRASRAAQVEYGANGDDGHVRMYLSVLRWLAFLSEAVGAAAVSTLVECFVPLERERPALYEWLTKCVTTPVEAGSVQDLCIDMPERAYWLLFRRLSTNREWALVDLGHQVDVAGSRFVLAAMAARPRAPLDCLFLKVPVREGSGRYLVLVCTKSGQIWSRVGSGVYAASSRDVQGSDDTAIIR
jgi:hypothetical protein